MKSISILFLILFYYSQPQLSNEERNNLLKKVTKSISIESFFRPLTSDEEESNGKIYYEASKIKEIIQKYKFPSSYNYIEQEKITPVIKDQANCGCCWSFASTTALAYRFHKVGKDVDLSAQYPLSCYLRDCKEGDFLIDSQFNLVKNGTTTDSCMPYTSSSGINSNIEKCPAKCGDGNDIEKFNSKSAYTTVYDYEQENYYDIVTVIMDQLINYGPVQASIQVYEDFTLLNDKLNCGNEIYKYDGKSESVGGHAVVIVGYGQENNKFYWIIQNSWGTDFCDDGFAKIEFAEIGIEAVSFSQPYIEDNSPAKDISITFTKVNEYCNYYFTSTNSENYFEMFFNNNDLKTYFQCGSSPKSDGKNNEGICSMSQRSLLNERGTYKYSDYNTLLNQDKYTLNFASGPLKEFQYYGADTVVAYSDIYISESGSTITLPFGPVDEESVDYPNIYPNEKVNTPLSDCKVEDFAAFKVIVCTIKSNELSYFSSSNNLPLVYDFLCGKKQEIGKVSLIDKKNYPVFRIKEFLIEDSQNYANSNLEVILLADIEGSVSQIKKENYFFVGIKIERNSRYTYNYMPCQIPIPKKTQTNFNIYCETSETIFNNIYLAQYYFPDSGQEPFEVIIKNDIKGKKDDDIHIFRSSNSLYNINIYLLILFGLLSL
jgi:cathepsin B